MVSSLIGGITKVEDGNFVGREFEGSGTSGLVLEAESCKIVPRRALPIHLFRVRHFCCSICTMYRLATMHNITDRRRDSTIMPLADHTAVEQRPL